MIEHAITDSDARAWFEYCGNCTTAVGAAALGRGGLLYPQQNQLRNVLDTSGVWQFQLDPKEKGEAKGRFRTLSAPRPIAVPCSWSGLFDDARQRAAISVRRRRPNIGFRLTTAASVALWGAEARWRSCR